MIEHIVAIFAGTLALGMVTWHITRIISDGSVFEPMRDKLWRRYEETKKRPIVRAGLYRLFYRGLSCRLCFGTEIAFVVTWGALIAGLIVSPSELPAAGWVLAFALGPLLTASWAEILRRVECLEAPE